MEHLNVGRYESIAQQACTVLQSAKGNVVSLYCGTYADESKYTGKDVYDASKRVETITAGDVVIVPGPTKLSYIGELIKELNNKPTALNDFILERLNNRSANIVVATDEYYKFMIYHQLGDWERCPVTVLYSKNEVGDLMCRGISVAAAKNGSNVPDTWIGFTICAQDTAAKSLDVHCNNQHESDPVIALPFL